MSRRPPRLTGLFIGLCWVLQTQAADLADAGTSLAGYGVVTNYPGLYMPTMSDFGGAGLLQTPTARMFEAGEVALVIAHVDPYRRGSLTFQPVEWLEANIRYTDISNREYDASGTISTQSYKDKGIDFKFGLMDEGRFLPELALGLRDVGGTGMFASEYLVASKRFLDVDISLGIAWGYMGNRGDMNNPFSLFGDRFDDRADYVDPAEGGQVNFGAMFRGEPAFFGGIEYQTPWQPLALKLEYEGNNYRLEPMANNQKQASPVNAAAVFNITPMLTLQAGIERGNTALLGFTLHTNLARTRPQVKLSDPRPMALKETPVATAKTDWARVSHELQHNAGYTVTAIARRDHELLVTGEQKTFYYHAEGIGRAARILHNHADADIEWLTVIDAPAGMPVKETSLARDTFIEVANNDATVADLRRTLSESVVSGQDKNVLYTDANPDPLSYGLGVGYKQSLGGPDRFILYQFTADAGAEYRFRPDLWWSGSLAVALLDNYDQFVYDGPSNLPRVRTDIRQYLTSSNVMMPVFQLSYAHALTDDVFGMAYAGMLETMYGGVGGELLYRPLGEELAIGIDVNWVRQRAYEQDFNFRPYETVTGHLSAYWDTGYEDVLVTTSIGRYLARDWGLTLDICRTFRNGVTMGGYATRTNVSSEEFGEGSFDKGIYISIPFDLMLTSSTLREATLRWSPLTRDGGARLQRRHSLYRMTDERDLRHFHDNLDFITE